MARANVALSLFWRTFFLLALLLVGGIFAWVQTLRALEFEPRAVQAAQQIASLVNLARAALRHCRRHQPRLADQDHDRPGGGARPAARAGRQLGAVRHRPLHAARSPPNCARGSGPAPWWPAASTAQQGLWVGFSIDNDPYWLQTDPSRVGAADRQHLVRLGAASRCWPRCSARRLIARLINRPLKRPVLCRQPHPRGRLRLAPRREHADQRDPRGQHRLQPHGARTGQGRGGPRRDAGRHLARPAHAAGAAAAGNRDERRTTRRPSATWRWTSSSSTPSSTSSWTTRARAT